MGRPGAMPDRWLEIGMRDEMARSGERGLGKALTGHLCNERHGKAWDLKLTGWSTDVKAEGWKPVKPKKEGI